MPETVSYVCPCCGGKIEWNGGTGKMKCPFCDTEFETETLEDFAGALQAQPEENMEWEDTAGQTWDGEEDSVSTYRCQACGGVLMTDAATAASKCPFCDSPVILTDRLSGERKPDLVIPFGVDKEGAKAALQKHLEKKFLLPKVFREENHLDDIKGVYVPVWLFDAQANAYIRFHATKTRSWTDSRYSYTETTHYSVIRGGTLEFENVPVDGSSKMDDTLMEAIEPFDAGKGVDFETAYLSGYLADRYDVSAEETVRRANERIRQSTLDEFQKTVQGYSGVVKESDSLELRDGRTRYALYPVWLLNTTWKDKSFTFAMNGQTGKFVGNLPVDRGKAALLFAAVTLVVTLLTYLVGALLMG